jgi:hypothetical protein
VKSLITLTPELDGHLVHSRK